MKKGFTENIEQATRENTDFRRVIYTAEHSQLVLMSLKPLEEIGLETHPDNDQFFRFETGRGKVVINETSYEVKDGDAVIIPAGAEHNIINTSDTDFLKMYTIYSPAHHKDGVVHATKENAESDHEEFDGKTSEN
mgnify:CR=1 FL=1